MDDYTPKSNRAEWHITYKCDLACPNCNRLCFLPPTTPDMTLDDAREFVKQAKDLGWSPDIIIIGGEPTLHNDLFEFIEIAKELGSVSIFSNGYSNKAKENLKQIREEGMVWICEESIKSGGSVKFERGLSISPQDSGIENYTPCNQHSFRHPCGISVDSIGYTICPLGGAIDSVLNLKVRTKNLRDLFDVEFAHKQTCSLCGVCGLSIKEGQWNKEGMETIT